MLCGQLEKLLMFRWLHPAKESASVGKPFQAAPAVHASMHTKVQQLFEPCECRNRVWQTGNRYAVRPQGKQVQHVGALYQTCMQFNGDLSLGMNVGDVFIGYSTPLPAFRGKALPGWKFCSVSHLQQDSFDCRRCVRRNKDVDIFKDTQHAVPVGPLGQALSFEEEVRNTFGLESLNQAHGFAGIKQVALRIVE